MIRLISTIATWAAMAIFCIFAECGRLDANQTANDAINVAQEFKKIADDAIVTSNEAIKQRDAALTAAAKASRIDWHLDCCNPGVTECILNYVRIGPFISVEDSHHNWANTMVGLDTEIGTGP